MNDMTQIKHAWFVAYWHFNHTSHVQGHGNNIVWMWFEEIQYKEHIEEMEMVITESLARQGIKGAHVVIQYYKREPHADKAFDAPRKLSVV
jgi:hypothetical protein